MCKRFHHRSTKSFVGGHPESLGCVECIPHVGPNIGSLLYDNGYDMALEVIDEFCENPEEFESLLRKHILIPPTHVRRILNTIELYCKKWYPSPVLSLRELRSKFDQFMATQPYTVYHKDVDVVPGIGPVTADILRNREITTRRLIESFKNRKQMRDYLVHRGVSARWARDTARAIDEYVDKWAWILWPEYQEPRFYPRKTSRSSWRRE